MTRAAYGDIEELYEDDVDTFGVLEDFSSKHPDIELSSVTITEVGGFYDCNR
jgi:hypothetical protein